MSGAELPKQPYRMLPDDPAFPAWVRDTFTRVDMRQLPADDIAALQVFATRRSYRRSTTLFERGAKPEAVFVVEQGAVDLVQENGSEGTVFQTARRGMSVGDLPVMLDLPHAYSAIAREGTTVLELRMDTIRVLVEIDSDVCYRFLRLVSRRLAGMERRVFELGGRPAFERVVFLLLRESDERGLPTVRLSQANMASMLGLSRQTVSKILGELDRMGLVERRRGLVRIEDRDRLDKLIVPHAPT